MVICCYLLEANIYLSVAYLFYALLLKRYTFFQQHRYYLLFVSFFCFVIPLISWKGGSASRPIQAVQEIVEPALSAIPGIRPATVPVGSLQSFTGTDLLLILFCVVALVNILRLVHGVIRIALLHRRSEKLIQDGMTIALLAEQHTVFSFFSWIFSHRSFVDDRFVREHEMIHARELHSADILWFELVRAINWFNPVSYFLLKSAKINHEFIVDAKLAEKNDPYAYAITLITHARAHSLDLTHAAFASDQIEARMERMIAEKSSHSSRRLLLLFFPVLMPLIFFSVFRLDKKYALLTILEADQSTVVAHPETIVYKTPLDQEASVETQSGDSHRDTIPVKEVRFADGKRKVAQPNKQTITGRDPVLQKEKELAYASLYPSSVEDRRETSALPPNENRPMAGEKVSVYGKYASLQRPDTSVDHNKNLRRVVSVYPQNRYGDAADKGTGSSVSLFDSTRYRRAFSKIVI
ncbi:MAG: hypothetical protein ABW007_01525 [Chitinophagaceae bacterium]